MRKVLIVRCSDSMRWYAELVGQYVEYLGDTGVEFKSREKSGYLNFVQYDDGILVDDGEDCGVLAIARLADELESEAEELASRARVLRYGAEDLRKSLLRFGVSV